MGRLAELNKIIFIFVSVCIMLSGCQKEDKEKLIREGLYIYVSAPYKKYSDEELDYYFSKNIVKDIKYLYMPYVYTDDNGKINLYKFTDYELIPQILVQNIELKEDNSYIAEVKFGEADFLYDLIVKDNKISFLEKRMKN